MTTKEQVHGDEQKFDLRIVDRQIRRGKVNAKDYEAYLKKLPDDSDNVQYVEVYEEPPQDEPTPHIERLTFTSA